MKQEQIDNLEDKVDALLGRFDKINSENHQLRRKVNELQAERDRLNHRNEAARKQIDVMISRLKSI